MIEHGVVAADARQQRKQLPTQSLIVTCKSQTLWSPLRLGQRQDGIQRRLDLLP